MTSSDTVVQAPRPRPDPERVPVVPAGAPDQRRGSLTRWQHRYADLIRLSDLVVVTVGTFVGVVVDDSATAAAAAAHVVSGLAAAGLLLIGLAATRAWDPRILGAGATEFKRLSHAVVGSALVLSLVGLILQVLSVRPWVLLHLPVIGLVCALARTAIRKGLHRRRRAGDFLLPVLVVGSEDDVADLVARTTRDCYYGWVVTAACTATGPVGSARIAGVPVIGDLDQVARLARAGDYRVVAVAPTPGWGPDRLRQLSWDLENTAIELAVHPGLMEIAGPRLHIAPVDGMPLLRLTEPRFTGLPRLLKSAVDRVGAAFLILALLPVLVGIAVAIRLEGGPVFYLQERVGVRSKRFRMVKFRSMVVGAADVRTELAVHNQGSGPMFKMRRDPRVTRVGAVLRRYSLDELPQLFNVLTGSMSLVGPRPPLPVEVESYGTDAHRRMLVRPGMTGLWQVSGRSDLSWEQSIRLDLRYVENWSLALDATILWKTFGAVVKGRGAY